MTRAAWALASLGVAALVSSIVPLGCSHAAGTATPTYLDRETMLDPQTCGNCHIDHYKDWVGSMHAYASDDPVFQAMNARGQRETGGQLGSFCVQCHAPLALEEGATTDGTNLSTVPQKLKGVTCFFCHTIDAVTGSHNAAVTLSGDLVMRGEYDNPVANTAHASTYAVLQDRDHIESASMCGACHDIVAPPGAAIERTYAEWLTSTFADTDGGETCGQCHMNQGTSPKPIAQAQGAGPREYHAHDFPAVDVALTPGFANATAEQQTVATFLQTTLQTALCVTQQGGVRVIVDNVSAGHFFPSGAAQDRRAWAEVIASKGGQVIYQSGVVPDGTPVVSIQNDPDLWLLRDCMFDATNTQVDMFWQAARSEGNELTMPVTTDKTDPRYYQTHIYQNFPRALNATLPQLPDQVTVRIRLQPIGLDVLDDLVSTQDLDAGFAAAMPTFDVAPLLTWTPAEAMTEGLTYEENGEPVTCVSATGFNVAADKNLATENAGCTP
ncbi:MAG TPA: multiheme c-type cytochrome [Polyangiaceae bacterium]|jgi:nitrate/TMAO reductase-like tetraheme cytochrome c subunit